MSFPKNVTISSIDFCIYFTTSVCTLLVAYPKTYFNIENSAIQFEVTCTFCNTHLSVNSDPHSSNRFYKNKTTMLSNVYNTMLSNVYNTMFCLYV